MSALEMTPTERSALVAYQLALGKRLTTREVSRMTGIKIRSARKLLYTMSRVIPLMEEGGEFMCLGVGDSEVA